MTDAHRIAENLKCRRRAEARFRWFGRSALIVSLVMLVVLLGSLIVPGIAGMRRSEVAIGIHLDSPVASISESAEVVRAAWLQRLDPSHAPNGRMARLRLLAPGYDLEAYDRMNGKAGSLTIWLPLADPADRFLRGEAGAENALPPIQRDALESLRESGELRRVFHWGFLGHGDSRSPEKAGMASSITGSLWVLAITFAFAFPVGIAAAIYLEEFSRKGRLRDLVEVNINNLAAVPSIIYGLLGLAVYLNLFGVPRSAALAGGMTLALLILPVIIITTRAALGAVPPSIKSGALALGASPLQVVRHHTLPLALPGILTGTILGVARALGETAPLLMIGMVAFVADVPKTPLDPATAMPVQIYLWASSPEAGFADKTASGILVLLAILLILNLGAIILRRKTERRW